MRVIIPPTGNETISMLKTTSLAIVVGSVYELTTVGQQISNYNFKVIELLFVVSFWYLVMTSVLTCLQYYVERRFARGAQRALPLTPLQRARRLLLGVHAPPPP
jgi:polar amino acid transport system permease protein